MKVHKFSVFAVKNILKIIGLELLRPNEQIRE